MKLNKLLTVLAPIALVGTICPAIVSCSCGGDSMTINYGDDINCKDKKSDVKYHSLSAVQNAVKAKVNVCREREVSIGAINSEIASDKPEAVQNIYFDLLASKVITDQQEILLTEYKAEKSGTQYNISFKLDGVPVNPLTGFKYLIHDESGVKQVYLGWTTTGNVDNKYCRSYTYKDCTPID